MSPIQMTVQFYRISNRPSTILKICIRNSHFWIRNKAFILAYSFVLTIYKPKTSLRLQGVLNKSKNIWQTNLLIPKTRIHWATPFSNYWQVN